MSETAHTGPAQAGPTTPKTWEKAAFNNSSFKRNYTLSQDGYLLIPNGDQQLLVDTGAPTSLGNGLTGVPGIHSANEGVSSGSSLTTWLGEHVHHVFDGIIGAEVLHQRTLVIDPLYSTLELALNPIASTAGVPVRHMMNVPIFDGVIAGRETPVIFDTGAPTGYVPREMTRGSTPIDRVSDFYPLFGSFETDVYELPLQVGAECPVVRFGVLPESIEQMHAMMGLPALIGLALLEKYRISVGLREQRLLLEPAF